MQVYGELGRAQLENLGSAPGVQLKGRVFFRSDLLEAYLDNGTLFSQFLVNDQKIVVGTSVTAAQNVRAYRGGTGILALVTADDATAEASITSAKLAQLAFRHENFTDAGKPSAAIAGRTIYATDLASLEVDSGTAWTVIGPATLEPRKNFLLNANFDIWQRGTALATIPWGTAAYGPDRWYGKNTTGNSTTALTITQTTGVSTTAKYGCQIKVTTGNALTQPFELNQVLENFDSMELYNQTASCSIQVKAVGNITSVGIQFGYATSEAKLTNYIGSEVTVAVNTSTFVAATILAQALGTAMTTSGVLGVRIRATAVSSGAINDLNNGFVIEQAIWVKGASLPIEFQRAKLTFAEELLCCQRFYEKSYDLTVAPGTATGAGEDAHVAPVNGATFRSTRFVVPKRATAGAFHAYGTTTGTIDKVRDGTAASDLTATYDTAGMNAQSNVNFTTGGANHSILYQWAMDAEI